jgi:hypothetical protein
MRQEQVERKNNMYEQVEKKNVVTELNKGSKLYVVDIPTCRIMPCGNMSMDAIKSFEDKESAMFFKEVDK